jgi:putative ABC transport system ATP-binding protein
MISVRGLTHRYGAAEALRLPEWRVAQGERWLVLGASGSGKTTLLHILAGLVRPSGGEVEVFDTDILSLEGTRLDAWRGANVGIVLQALHLVKHLTVRDNLRLAQYLAHLPQDEARVADTLGALGVADKAARKPAQLSQGEQQRVAIARAFVAGPDVLFADEPTGNLDSGTGGRIMDLLFGLNASAGTTLILVTHDRSIAARCGRLVRLDAGRMVEGQA